jgi:hypothetical protein
MNIPGSTYGNYQPMTYQKQLYHAKLPWFPETGRPCKGNCGVTGTCVSGVCQAKDYKDTVFGITL